MRPKADALQGSLDLLVLKILSRRFLAARLRHYVRHSGHFRRGPARGGGLPLPALHRMEESVWIRAEWVIKENGRRARVYELTTAGKKQLGMEESRWKVVAAVVNRALREA